MAMVGTLGTGHTRHEGYFHPMFALHPMLEERVRPLNALEPRIGKWVVYWMRTAVRAQENPALDVAIAVGNALELPVLVYHGLSERYPFASDRHHRFILEGAQDVALGLERRGVRHVMHVERPGHRGAHLLALAAEAALVVTEDMPVEPLRTWTERLARRNLAPVWCVDTACVVPMQRVPKAFTRAFRYRQATEELREERLGLPWEDLSPRVSPDESALPFEPVDLQRVSLSALIASCDIDHSVGPVPHTRGGTRAGKARWASFVRHGLRSYAHRRNDALLDGVSRMSAYLHYGQVSPMYIARQCVRNGSSGARKFLDELLIWRELSYSWCFHTPVHDTLDAIPGWARESLKRETSTQRPVLPPPEALARGMVGEPLWDAAQASLRIHGELHNNVRMTWGKALLQWTAGPEEALAQLLALNNRFALDGRDPCSYGGLLWCLGQFDRPFSPPQPIFGAVRARSLAQHAERLDVDAYRRRVMRPPCEDPGRTAVIGAGLSGALCARLIVDHGHAVDVFGPVGEGAAEDIELTATPLDRMAHSWHFWGYIQLSGERYRVDPARLSTSLTPAWPRPCPHRIERVAGGWYVWDEDGQRSGPYVNVVLADATAHALLPDPERHDDVFVCAGEGAGQQLLSGVAAAGRVFNHHADQAGEGRMQADLFSE